MDQCEALMKLIMEAVKNGTDAKTDSEKKPEAGTIPVGVSNRHVHLSAEDLETLFGAGYELTKLRDLSQPGQFACKETVTVCGPKGAIEKVRILGPVRKASQIEILAGDSFNLGVKAPVKLSGDLEGTPGITLVGPKGSVQTKNGVMVAQRHIHMLLSDAERFGVHDGERVCLEVDGERGGVLRNTVIRVTDQSALEYHLDMDEANAMGLGSSSTVRIVR